MCPRVCIYFDNCIRHMGQYELQTFFAGGGAFFHGNKRAEVKSTLFGSY